MARVRKRHEQQDFLTLDGRLRRDRRGGKRRGAGRKPKGPRAGSPHKTRPEITRRDAVHIVIRVEKGVGSLRKRYMYAALWLATLAVARRELFDDEEAMFRIIHVSIQQTHIHLIVEAANKTALARGMQSFEISAAKRLNSAISKQRGERRKGRVFEDRYFEEVIKTPRQARNALAYVLNNWRKHREDNTKDTQRWKVDAFSTAILFNGWREREAELFMWKPREAYKPLIVYLPQTWLLREGWRRGGGPIPFGFVPSQSAGMRARV